MRRVAIGGILTVVLLVLYWDKIVTAQGPHGGRRLVLILVEAAS